jgi:EAL domain-containing protein (putative c-di-GMP-specific phosphodiesterase class I)
MRLGDEQLAGFAAQVRWQNPKLGTLNAAEFMPIAEEAGLISEISTYVMERAVRQVARWHRTLPRHEDQLFVTVNISSRRLFKQELVQDIKLVIGRESVPKGCLRLEIPESLIMENPEQAIEILDWLKGLGAGISLNEFGAGYSSLAYLHRLAVDTIKIDRSLISHGSDNKSGAVVLRAAMAMARELGKDVIAVAMEREEDVAYVRALGCDYAQGLYFGEAMTEREVMSVLNALSKSSRRDGKRVKKRKGDDEELLADEMMGDDSDAPLPLTEEVTASDARNLGGQAYGLPVPQTPVAKRSRGFGAGLLSALFRPFISSPDSPSLGARMLGLFKSNKKSRKPKGARPRVPAPGRAAPFPADMQAPPMRGHARGHEDPYAPPPQQQFQRGGQQPKAPPPIPPKAGPPSRAVRSTPPPPAPQMAEAAADEAAPDLLMQAEATNLARRRRV